MGCRPAPTCAAALAEATKRWPGRSKASDGTCGDSAHAARKSDHNPAADGYAHAFDLTHDTKAGVDTYRLADQLRLRAKAGRETRIKYIISNRRICSGPGWDWRAYSGANPHDKHFHVSVTSAATHDTAPWFDFALTAHAATVTPITAKESDDMFSEADRALLAALRTTQGEDRARLDRTLQLLELAERRALRMVADEKDGSVWLIVPGILRAPVEKGAVDAYRKELGFTDVPKWGHETLMAIPAAGRPA